MTCLCCSNRSWSIKPNTQLVMNLIQLSFERVLKRAHYVIFSLEGEPLWNWEVGFQSVVAVGMETLAAQITPNPCNWSLSSLPALHRGDEAHRQHEGGKWGKKWMFMPCVITFLDLKSAETERNISTITAEKQLLLCNKASFCRLCRLKGVSWASCEHPIVTYYIHQLDLEGKFQTW